MAELNNFLCTPDADHLVEGLPACRHCNFTCCEEPKPTVGATGRGCRECGKRWPDDLRKQETAEPEEEPHIEAASPPIDPDRTFTVVVRSSLGTGRLRIGSGERVILGRDLGPIAHLCTDNVSGRHADLYANDRGIFIEDVGTDGVGSTNGTYVGEKRLVPRHAERLKVGTTVRLANDPPLTLEIETGGPG